MPKAAQLVRCGRFGIFRQREWEEGARGPAWIEPYYVPDYSSPSHL